MVGGEAEAVHALAPLLSALAPAPDRGWVHCGRSGAGHYAKMVHNGIEYGMMQSLCRGLRADAREGGPRPRRREHRRGLAPRHGDPLVAAGPDREFLGEDADLEAIAPFVSDSGEGRWTAHESIDLGVPTPVMTLALMQRFASQGRADYSDRLLARMRQAFSGHPVKLDPPPA